MEISTSSSAKNKCFGPKFLSMQEYPILVTYMENAASWSLPCSIRFRCPSLACLSCFDSGIRLFHSFVDFPPSSLDGQLSLACWKEIISILEPSSNKDTNFLLLIITFDRLVFFPSRVGSGPMD